MDRQCVANNAPMPWGRNGFLWARALAMPRVCAMLATPVPAARAHAPRAQWAPTNQLRAMTLAPAATMVDTPWRKAASSAPIPCAKCVLQGPFRCRQVQACGTAPASRAFLGMLPLVRHVQYALTIPTARSQQPRKRTAPATLDTMETQRTTSCVKRVPPIRCHWPRCRMHGTFKTAHATRATLGDQLASATRHARNAPSTPTTLGMASAIPAAVSHAPSTQPPVCTWHSPGVVAACVTRGFSGILAWVRCVSSVLSRPLAVLKVRYLRDSGARCVLRIQLRWLALLLCLLRIASATRDTGVSSALTIRIATPVRMGIARCLRTHELEPSFSCWTIVHIIPTCTRTHTRTRTPTHTRTQTDARKRTHAHIRAHTHEHPYTHPQTHTHKRTYTRKHIHTYNHTQTQTHSATRTRILCSNCLFSQSRLSGWRCDCILPRNLSRCLPTHTYIQIWKHTNIYTCKQAYMHTFKQPLATPSYNLFTQHLRINKDQKNTRIDHYRTVAIRLQPIHFKRHFEKHFRSSELKVPRSSLHCAIAKDIFRAFASRFGKNFQNCHFKWDWLY